MIARPAIHRFLRTASDSLRRVDRLLRGDAEWLPPAGRGSVGWHLPAVLLLAGGFYGAVMGTFGGVGAARLPQMAYSAIKVPLLLAATFCLSLPSFFVLGTLLGLRQDFGRSLRALASAQAALTVVLASLAPFTALWYASSGDYPAAILFNAAMFATASGGARVVLRRSYADLAAANPRHRWMLRFWLLLYAFVGTQMGWVLRPFVGNPKIPTTFFRPDAWSNAYVFVFHLVVGAVR